MRQKNKADMTITEQIQRMVEEFCNHYCKWSEQFDEEAEGCELSESEHCQNCPFNEV